MHVTQSCDDDGPHLVTDVQTTPAPVSDFDITPPIVATLARQELLPNEQLLDAGYMTAAHVISSQRDYGIDLVGPIAPDTRGPRSGSSWFWHRRFSDRLAGANSPLPSGTSERVVDGSAGPQ